MIKFLIQACLVLTLISCSSLKNKSSSVEISNYVLNHVAEVPITINQEDLVINLVNAASAEKIVIFFNVKNNLDREVNLTINCMSQCKLEFAGDLKDLKFGDLTLINAYFITNPSIQVQNITIKSSEAIKTGLPIVKNKAKIVVESSENMLAVQKLLKAVNIIPGSGEFVYDTKIVYDKYGKPINSYNGENIADALYNIYSLKETIPNLSWAAPVVSWFAINTNSNLDNMNVKNLEIVPSVENKYGGESEPWKVAYHNRDSARIVSMDSNNRPNYGGTINDQSLLRYIQSLSENKLKIMFYPMIFMDLPGKPWRGYIYGNNTQDIHEFFNKKNGYNAFILHYAHLLKGKIDAFVIGSEMQDLTQSVDEKYEYPDPRRYPAVLELINLAKLVREVLGDDVVITYAANWSEYHHDKNGFYHLDPLWASKYIDVVGIDAYLPITNKSMGDITISDIKQGWESGELWDYYYDRNNISTIPPEWGLKRIEYWWKTNHWKSGYQTLWIPRMKPIWFTEFGFPSMHMATNTPNVFWDPKSTASDVPKRSSGRPDFAIQMRAIRATLEYWQNKDDVVGNMFLWAWDIRPFPYYPQKIEIWSDGDLWSRGHWINGKITPFSQVRILSGADVKILEIDAEELVIEGYINAQSIKAKNIQYIH